MLKVVLNWDVSYIFTCFFVTFFLLLRITYCILIVRYQKLGGRYNEGVIYQAKGF